MTAYVVVAQALQQGMVDPIKQLGVDMPSLAYAVAMIVGTFVRCWGSTTQKTRSSRTGVEVVGAAFLGLLTPALEPWVPGLSWLGSNLTVLQKASFLGLLSLAGSWGYRVFEMRLTKGDGPSSMPG
jgi:hypothetical protein